MKRESEIERLLVKSVKNAGGLCLKLYSPNYVGIPDRIVLIALGRIAFVEVKQKGCKPRRIQLKRHAELERLGFRVYVLDDEHDIKRIIDEMKGDWK